MECARRWPCAREQRACERRRVSGGRAFVSAFEISSGPGLSAAVDAILERGQLLGADGPARVQAAGGDADLAAEAEFAAVGELSRGVVEHNGRIDLLEKSLRYPFVVGDDR